MIEQILTLFGFREKSASLFAWASVILLAVVSVTIFFLSYSLARHKRMVGELRAQIISLDAEREKKEVERKGVVLRFELYQLEQQKQKTAQQREAIKAEIQRKIVDEERRKTALDAQIKKLDKKSLKQLIEQAEQLERDTL